MTSQNIPSRVLGVGGDEDRAAGVRCREMDAVHKTRILSRRSYQERSLDDGKVYKYVSIVYKLVTMNQALEEPQLHSPTLDTIQMVEEAIKKAKEVITIAELKRKLPRQVNHNTLKVILRYLQESGKIEFTPDGIIWIFLPKEDIASILSKGRTWS